MRPRYLVARAVLWCFATVGFLSMVFLFCSFSHFGEDYDRPRVTVARAQLANLQSVLELYRIDSGVYPTTDQGLRALVCGPSRLGWRNHLDAFIPARCNQEDASFVFPETDTQQLGGIPL